MNKKGDVGILTPEEGAGLLFMREEEKLARDVYLVLFDKWRLRVFENIAQSEHRHMDAVSYLCGLALQFRAFFMGHLFGLPEHIYYKFSLFIGIGRGTLCPIPVLQKIEYLRMNDTIVEIINSARFA